MDRIVLDLLKFYQKEIRETKEARVVLKALNITPATVEHYQLGYSTGKAFNIASKEQRKHMRALDLAGNWGDRFKDSIVLPVFAEGGALVDLYGVRQLKGQTKRLLWQDPTQGLIGVSVLTNSPEVILTDNPVYALQMHQQGHVNVVALRDLSELDRLLPLLQKHDTRRVYTYSRLRNQELLKPIEKVGIEAVKLKSPQRGFDKGHLVLVGTLPTRAEPANITLTERTDHRLTFKADSIEYRLESTAMSGLGMKVQIRAESDGVSFRDKLDLAASSQRRSFARACGMRLGVTANQIDDHLNHMADQIDNLITETVDNHTRQPRRLKNQEKQDALSVLQAENVLEYQSKAMQKHLHFIGEEQNRKLSLLVAASRLLQRPLGAILRGPAGCGKSALIQATTKALPMSEVLYFSRMTSQSLFFMPKGQLQNKLLVVDEYEGMQDSEYAIRTMMSSQTLSLAITVREGGRVPVTRTIEIPATVSVMVSTTGSINSENLSRFIEMRLDASPDQNHRVMKALAKERQATGKEAEEDITALQNISQLLKPCGVTIPYADRLIYKSGNVLARRQFAQVVGLISAHAALHQYQRNGETVDGQLHLTASKEDYEAVYPLLAHVIDHFEEGLSPSSMQLLEAIQSKDTKTLTRKEAMDWLGWPYSRVYRVLKELTSLDLLISDSMSNGVERIYEVAPYFQTQGGVSQIAPPSAV